MSVRTSGAGDDYGEPVSLVSPMFEAPEPGLFEPGRKFVGLPF